MKNTFYMTTPLYYPSDKLHIGHAYSSTIADTMCKYKRLRGFDVRFLTGTDDHGQKIEEYAKKRHMEPKAYVDEIVQTIYDLWDRLDIQYDAFVRTTDESHVEYIQKVFVKLYEQGDIYKGTYSGYYCTPCEAFYTERQLVNNHCPDCNRPVSLIDEDAYFFRLSNYTDKLLEHIEKNPDFIQPEFRKREMIENFLKPGLEDLSVTRASITWGVPVPFDPEHVIYVWIDALSGYISSLNKWTDDESLYNTYWPADIHLVGKEIVRFHTIIWPALLMALDFPLPKQVYAHGFWLTEGDKMSKSKGNVIDPVFLIERYGKDATRYFLLREMSVGQDASFSYKNFITRINADLANDLGNLLSRTVSMIDLYFGGQLPKEHVSNEFDPHIRDLAKKTVQEVEEAMEGLQFHNALKSIWAFISSINKYADETEPWVLGREEKNHPKLAGVLYTMAESLRFVAVLLQPMLPDAPKNIFAQLNLTDPSYRTWASVETFDVAPKDITVTKKDVLFPRIDVEKELLALEELLPDVVEEEKKESKNKKEDKNKENKEEKIDTIGFQQFLDVKVVVGEITSCKKVEGADKLLSFIVDIGAEKRQIVSGIAAFYSPEELLHKKVLVVKNLAVAKIFGIESQGMILSTEDSKGNISIIEIDPSVENGSEVS